MYARTGARALVAAALLPLVAACNEDPGVFSTVGTARVFFTDPFLASQSIKDPGLPLQVAEWSVSQAVLDVEGAPIDLLAGSSTCKIVDTVSVTPQSSDKCGGGLVVEVRPQAVPTKLSVRFTMSVRRAKPIDLPPADDYDADGIPNADDTCPLLANPEQTLAACSFIDSGTGALVTDSDGDRVGDPVDNCVAVANAGQTDLAGPALSDGVRVPDLIGDACEEQIAAVQVAGSTEIELASAPLDYVQGQFQLTYWVVDLSNPDTLTCNWGAGACELAPGAVQICIANGGAAALAGCPG